MECHRSERSRTHRRVRYPVVSGRLFSRTRSAWWPAVAIVAASTFSATFAGVARAQEEPPPPNDSAVVQYTELVPTGTGPKAPGVGREQRDSLPKETNKALESVPKSTADSLTEVATSSNYGAPATRPAPTTRPSQPPRDTPEPSDAFSLDRTLQATAVAAAPVDDARMVGLLVAMLAIAAGGGALAVRKRRG